MTGGAVGPGRARSGAPFVVLEVALVAGGLAVAAAATSRGSVGLGLAAALVPGARRRIDHVLDGCPWSRSAEPSLITEADAAAGGGYHTLPNRALARTVVVATPSPSGLEEGNTPHATDDSEVPNAHR